MRCPPERMVQASDVGVAASPGSGVALATPAGRSETEAKAVVATTARVRLRERFERCTVLLCCR
jgi:hypothetical protein